MDGSIISFLFTLISLVSPLLIFIACCYYLSKQVKVDAILLFIGSGITLLLSCFYLIMPYLMRRNFWSASKISLQYSVMGVIGLVAGVSFAVGLFMLINNMINANKMIQGKF